MRPSLHSGVIVQRALQIAPFDEARKRFFFREREFAAVLAAFRRHVIQAELLENFLFRVAFDEQLRIARLLLGAEQAVFVQPQAALNRALAHDDVVLLAAGEIHQGKRKFRVGHHAQIGLNAAFEQHAGFRFALRDDACWRLSSRFVEKIDDASRVFRRHEQVNVADDFLASAQTAGFARPNHVGMRAQVVEDGFSGEQGIVEVMFRGIRAAAIDAFANVHGGFFAETLSFATRPSWQAFSNSSTPAIFSSSYRILIFLGPTPGISIIASKSRPGWRLSGLRNSRACRW